MNKKLEKLADIDLEDLASVTGGRGGAAVAMDIKKRQEREDRQRDRDGKRSGGDGDRD